MWKAVECCLFIRHTWTEMSSSPCSKKLSARSFKAWRTADYDLTHCSVRGIIWRIRIAIGNEYSVRPVILKETATLEREILLCQQLLSLALRLSFIYLRVAKMNAHCTLPSILNDFLETKAFPYLFDKDIAQEIILSRTDPTSRLARRSRRESSQ